MKLINTAEAAVSLGVSERRVRQLITEEKLKAQKVGRDYAIQEGDLKLVVARKPGRPPKAQSAQTTTSEAAIARNGRPGRKKVGKK
jgi:excisionase family DNA binding protein